MPKFNGHKNWNHWNVSLWIWNTEAIAKRAEHYLYNARTSTTWSSPTRRYTLDEAAKSLLCDITTWPPFSGIGVTGGIVLSGEYGQYAHTPDGAPYTFTSIRAALAGIR